MNHGWKFLRPEDRENILRGIADGNVYGGPYHLEVNWVDKCNARCFFCNSEWLHNGKSIAWPRAEQIFEEAVANGLRSIRLAGGGEPTLHPHLTDLFDLLVRHDIVLDHLTTNGTNFTPRVLEAFQRLRVQDVTVSLNYATPETYAKGMGLPEKFFHRVVEMTRALSQARRNNPEFGKLIIQFFVYRPTLDHLVDMYRLGRELGGDFIAFRELYGIEPELQLRPEDVPGIVESARTILREDAGANLAQFQLLNLGLRERIQQVYREVEQENGGATEVPYLAALPDNPKSRFCYIGWYSMTITGSQAAYPCCYLMHKEWIPPVSNLMEHSLQEVWRGPAYERFRAEMRRFFLMRERPADPGRELTYSDISCHSHTDCPLTYNMCDDEFYEEAERRLRAARKSPSVALAKARSKVGRALDRITG